MKKYTHKRRRHNPYYVKAQASIKRAQDKIDDINYDLYDSNYQSYKHDLNPIIAGFVLIAESIISIFGGPKPHLYKGTPIDRDEISDDLLENDWSDIRKDFEDATGFHWNNPYQRNNHENE